MKQRNAVASILPFLSVADPGFPQGKIENCYCRKLHENKQNWTEGVRILTRLIRNCISRNVHVQEQHVKRKTREKLQRICILKAPRSHFRYVDRIGNGINVVFGIVGNSLSLLTLCRKNMLKNVSTTYFIGLGEQLYGYICFIETHFVLNKFLLNSVADPGFSHTV